MHKKIFSALQLLNLLFQALYTLALPVGLGALASFLLTKYASAPSWIWAVLLTLGVLMGLYSMVKFIILASESMDRMEKQKAENLQARQEKEERQARLRAESKIDEIKGETEKSE